MKTILRFTHNKITRDIGTLDDTDRVYRKTAKQSIHFMKIYQGWGISFVPFKENIQKNADYIEINDTEEKDATYIYCDIRNMNVDFIDTPPKMKSYIEDAVIAKHEPFEWQIFIHTKRWKQSKVQLNIEQIRELFKEEVVVTPPKDEKKVPIQEGFQWKS